MLDIHEMQIFLAAAEAGSFSEAGRCLQLSQPAISMQIRALEKRLNVTLFHRAGRHIKLTEAGQALVPMARQLVNQAIQVQEAIAALQGMVTGTLRIACSTTAGRYVLPLLIAGFVERYPLVQVVCTVSGRSEAIDVLLGGEVQIAITSLRELSRELEYRHFLFDPIALIVHPSHPWAQRSAIRVSDLPSGRFILREPTAGTYQTVADALAEHGMNIRDLAPVMTLGNSEAILVAVMEGIGVAFLSRRAAARAIADGHVVEVPVEGLQMAQQLHMVRRAEHTMSAAAGAFWDFVYAPDNRRLLNGVVGNNQRE
ncbi:MAG: LysR substrate-binding domain-containing protein [Aggregatilineales bacterium]